MDLLPPLVQYAQAERTRIHTRLAREGLPDITALPYEQYLNTALWTRIKAWVCQRDEYRCRLCSREYSPRSLDELDVHHRTYDRATLEGLEDTQLISLCRHCHRRVEYCSGGSRRWDLAEKEAELVRLMALIQRIRAEGLAVRTERSGNRIHLAYCGDPAFQEFHHLTEVLVAFIFDLQRRHKDKVRLPLPFGTDSLYQPSGVRLLERDTNRTLLTLRSTATEGSIQIAKANLLPVESLLAETFTQERRHPFYWKQVAS